MKIDIYREITGDKVRPEMTVETIGDRPQAIFVQEVRLKAGGMIDLFGPLVLSNGDTTGKPITIPVRDSQTLRARPTREEVLGVWGSLCDAVRAAAADYLERQELDDDRPGAAAPWEVVGDVGQLLVSFRWMGFRLDPELPIPEPVDVEIVDDADDDGG